MLVSLVNTGTGTRNTTFIANLTNTASGGVLNLNNVNKFLIWPQSMRLRRNGGNFNLLLTPGFINSNNYSVVATVTGSTTLHFLTFSRLIYDKTVL